MPDNFDDNDAPADTDVGDASGNSPPQNPDAAASSRKKALSHDAPMVIPAGDDDAETYGFRTDAPPAHDERPAGEIDQPPPRSRKRGRPSGSHLARAAGSGKPGGLGVLMGANLLVFGASVCIMVLELTATRLIARHVGASLYTWTSVIGVVLTGITLGNYLGGWLADRVRPTRLTAWLFLIASALCFSVLWLDRLAANVERPDGWNWSWYVFALVAGIYLLPSLALGCISPVVASFALLRSEKVGITVGNVYAWGAFGSIVGTFLAGFYLIDAFGTKSIIGMTAAALATMGAIVAAGQNVFRAAVILGWLQLVAVVTLAAVATTETPIVGGEIGSGLQRLGLALNLRDDFAGAYHDESDYQYIYVGDETIVRYDLDNRRREDHVRFLLLDKLTHSYYCPARPTTLYYEYEQIYAAVTERATASRRCNVRVRLPDFNGRSELVAQLPGAIRYDADTETLIATTGVAHAVRDAVLALSPSVDYWLGLERLKFRSNQPVWGGYDWEPLGELPEGVNLPEELAETIAWDRFVRRLNLHGPLSDELFGRLIAAAPHAEFYFAVDELFQRSRQVQTFFIGGGGFIFPRWIEAFHPHRPVVHVAELDPAVKLAVQKEMGLPPDDETAVKTYTIDARRFVVEQLRLNRQLSAAGRTPMRYDFIYGDAFNDLSVPWHLTTLEFTQMVRSLLADDGVYLVNLIDILPRTQFPPPAEDGDVEDVYHGNLPKSLLPDESLEDGWTPCRDPNAALELFDSTEGRALGWRGRMTGEDLSRLTQLAPNDVAWTNALASLYERSRKKRTGRFLGRYVRTLAETFPNIYVFSSERGGVAHEYRDTFVIVCSPRKLDLAGEALEYRDRFPDSPVFDEAGESIDEGDLLSLLEQTLDDGDEEAVYDWHGRPFAWRETDAEGTALNRGQMPALFELSDGELLTDDHAPVENLLAPVVEDQAAE